jgi:predicted nucleic acid-binding protein
VTTLVVDASVAAKWYLPSSGEPHAAEAVELLKGYGSGQLQFLVPDFFWAEIGNIFWKAVRQGRWSQTAGEGALREIHQRRIPTVTTLTLLDDAFSIATTFDRSVYDSLYVALALASKCQFVTADERLANAVAAHLPVKWLGYFA